MNLGSTLLVPAWIAASLIGGASESGGGPREDDCGRPALGLVDTCAFQVVTDQGSKDKAMVWGSVTNGPCPRQHAANHTSAAIFLCWSFNKAGVHLYFLRKSRLLLGGEIIFPDVDELVQEQRVDPRSGEYTLIQEETSDRWRLRPITWLNHLITWVNHLVT